MIVSINGVLQVPGVDYVSTQSSIAFSSPPQSMSSIEIVGSRWILARILGDGHSYRFDFMSDLEHDLTYTLEDAFKLRHIPAVAEALERLQVVVALAKENG